MVICPANPNTNNTSGQDRKEKTWLRIAGVDIQMTNVVISLTYVYGIGLNI